MRKILASLLLAASVVAASAQQVVNPTFVGSGTVGNIVTVGSSSNQVQDSANATYANSPVAFNFSSNIAFSGAFSIPQTWLSVGGLSGVSLSGTPSTPANGVIASNSVYISTDTADTITSGNGNLIAFNVAHRTSAGSTGGRTALQGFENIVGTPTTINSSGYVGVVGLTRVAASFGGTTGVFNNYKGTAFGGTSNVFTSGSLPTFLSILNGHEFDVTAAAGSSVAEKHAASFVLGSADAVRATYDDSAVSFNAQDGGGTWLRGIQFGGYARQWPLGADSTMIGAVVRSTGTASPSIALNGVDFSSVTFQSGGCSFKSTGYCVDPSGNVTSPIIAASANGSQSTNAFRNSTNAGTGIYFPNNNQVAIAGNGSAGIVVNGSGLTSVQLGLSVTAGGATIGATTLTTTANEIGINRAVASSSAPGAAGAKLAIVCGTNAGTAKLIMYAGTSTTPVTVVDNVGAGVTGC